MRRNLLPVMLSIASSMTACAGPSSTEQIAKDTAMPEQTASGRTIDGYTYTTTPVEARIGPHRYRFPANYYDDQIGPYVGGGVGLTLLWPEFSAAPPGYRARPSAGEIHRAVVASIDHIDAVPINELLDRKASAQGTTEPGSLSRDDPRLRLDLRTREQTDLGLVRHAIDEKRMESFAARYQALRGEPPVRNPRTEDEWFTAEDTEGRLATFIKCDVPVGGRDGLHLENGELIADSSTPIALCTHYFVDVADSLSISLSYPRVLLADWRRMEEAVRAVLGRYKVD